MKTNYLIELIELIDQLIDSPSSTTSVLPDNSLYNSTPKHNIMHVQLKLKSHLGFGKIIL